MSKSRRLSDHWELLFIILGTISFFFLCKMKSQVVFCQPTGAVDFVILSGGNHKWMPIRQTTYTSVNDNYSHLSR